MRLARWLLRRVSSDRAATAIEGDLLESHRTDPGRPGLGARLRLTGHLLAVATTLWRAERRDSPRRADLLKSLAQDVRFAGRMLVARPAFSAVAILSLALGIGANTAIFSVLDAVLLRPLPVYEPERLVSTGTAIVSYPDYRDFRDRSTDVFESFATWETTSRARSLRGPSGVELVAGQLVSGAYFEMLGSRPLIGRLIEPLDDEQERQVVVLSERLWRRSFAADPSVVGSEVSVNDLPVTIVGVVGGGFAGHRLNRSIDFWVPLPLHPQLARGSRARMRLEDRGIQWLRLMGRLAPGVSVEQARQSLNGHRRYSRRSLSLGQHH